MNYLGTILSLVISIYINMFCNYNKLKTEWKNRLPWNYTTTNNLVTSVYIFLRNIIINILLHNKRSTRLMSSKCTLCKEVHTFNCYTHYRIYRKQSPSVRLGWKDKDEMKTEIVNINFIFFKKKRRKRRMYVNCIVGVMDGSKFCIIGFAKKEVGRRMEHSFSNRWFWTQMSENGMKEEVKNAFTHKIKLTNFVAVYLSFIPLNKPNRVRWCIRWGIQAHSNVSLSI